MKTQFSPGPWKYETATTCDTKASFDVTAQHGPTFDRFNVCRLTNPYSGTAEGNAKLITAAPELLAALQVIALTPVLRALVKMRDPQAFQQMTAAIAKATE